MMKISGYIKKCALFILVCFLPLFVSAWDEVEYTWSENFGTLSAGEVETSSNAWWDVYDCKTNKTGPFTFDVISEDYVYKKSYYRSVKLTVHDYVPNDINGIEVSCLYYDNDQGNPTDNSGRVFPHQVVKYKFNIKASATASTQTADRDFYLYKGQKEDLITKLNISQVLDFKYVSGSTHGTIGYSGCAEGGNVCQITFDSGNAVKNRKHEFYIKYVNVIGKTHETKIFVYEQENSRTDHIGNIPSGGYTFSIYEENMTNFTCSKVSSGPYEVSVDSTDNSSRIKVTSTNYSLTNYTSLQAMCTFEKDGVTHTRTYLFGLDASDAVEKNKDYDATGGEIFNIWNDLNIKEIVSSSLSFSSNATVTGCYPGNTSCSVNMKALLTDGQISSSTIIYYDTSNKLIQSRVNIKEEVVTVENNLETIGVGSTKYGNIPASDVTCSTTSSGKFEYELTGSDGAYVLNVKNVNDTVTVYDNQVITCSGYPNAVSGKVYKYKFKFSLDNQLVPIRDNRNYELFINESINFSEFPKFSKMYKNIEYTTGKTSGVMSVTGCLKDKYNCEVKLVGPDSNITHNRVHDMVLTYVSPANVLYETTVKIIEKDVNRTTRAYPGLLGFCDFDDSQWTYTSWFNAAGKRYSFYESEIRGAKLPDCQENASSGVLLEFKGWTKGYQAGDALNTMTTCGSDLLQPGQPTDYGQTYAPCYEMPAHVRLSINGGTVEGDTFEFNPKDMTYIAYGSNYDQEVELPTVVFTGFYASNEVKKWVNYSTGESKDPNEKVKLDGSVWVAVTSTASTQVDLYKTVSLDKDEDLIVSGMKACFLKHSSESQYVTVSYSSGVCTVTGEEVTPFDVYADVVVELNDGTTRVYKFDVEDRSKINVDDNGIFNVDIDENIEIGKNDVDTLNDFKTDQCEDFFISSAGYERFRFADSRSTGEAMNTGIYSVYQLCPTDMSTYVGLCLDPGRRGPNEYGTGTHSKTFEFKGASKTVNGNEYSKARDIDKDSYFGKVVMYIVKNMGINEFDNNSSPHKEKRAASHVAVRSMAIVEKVSSSPDTADEVYASHYYPYQGVADSIEAALADGEVTAAEATSAVEDGRGGLGFINWNSSVKSHLINILSNFDSSFGDGKSDGFERTIDDSTFTEVGDGYTINYKGTITAPTGADAEMTGCRNSSPYGVVCEVNGFSKVSETDGRKTYSYDVTVKVDDAGTVKPPSNVEEEKDLSFQITYSGGYDSVNAFIANPSNGSDNVQRMLIINTTNPKVYIYFSVVPNTCDLDVLDPAKCPDEATCKSNANAGNFNIELFKAAGCCKYQLNETTYLFKSVCSAECTSSTLTSVCTYTETGKEKADFYEINEGAKYESEELGYQDSIGTCIVNVQELYENDDATLLNYVTNSENFTKYDDGDNLLNVESYKDNRYCQVTCEEDWQFSMDSFGNFIGNDAVAAGTYFQIVSNDMFMGSKRTCYSTFINYDRFMTNIVDLSNQLVDWYNVYSRWSHVWTDIDEQTSYSSALYYDHTEVTAVCVEYFDKCPQGTTLGNYYWSEEVNDCRMVPDYGSADGSGDEGENCEAKPSTYSGYSHYDEDVYYTNSGANDDTTQCKFKRWYCDGNKDLYETDTIKESNNLCYYYTYYDKPSIKQDTESRDYTYKSDPDGSGPKGLECPSDTSPSGTKCYYDCGTGYYASGGTCYENVPSGYELHGGYFYEDCDSGWHEYTDYVCQNDYKSTYSASSNYLTMDPDYNEEDLKCRVWGKGYDYNLKTENDIQVTNSKGVDIYYGTEEYDRYASEGFDTRDSISNKGDYRRQNKETNAGNVKGFYNREYTHKCTLTAAEYKPKAQGSSSCVQADLDDEHVGADSYSKENEMFCADGNYANLTGGDLDKAFCYAGGSQNNTNNKKDADQDDGDYSNEKDAFDWVKEKFQDHAKKELDNARSQMVSLNSQIYAHAQDIFDCQNFQLHNRTDDSDASRANNVTPTDTIMGMTRSYVSINTDFDPTAAYTYDEKFFMERLDKDNVLIQYTEKNDALYGGSGQYAASTNKQLPATIQTPSGPVDTKLSRNFLSTSYYDPENPWNDVQNAEEVKKYHQDSSYTATAVKESKQIVLCSVSQEDGGTGYATGKDGALIPFSASISTPEWLGGICKQVTVDYKKVHYVKSSIENSSYYKNKGNWYVRGGDSKIHGDTISDAISKFNRIQPSGFIDEYDNDTEEHMKWSRLGSFNVFPISMATPRNLYQYTYTFGNIGSYYNGDLGRIMGTQKSIIQNNTRTCFYEVFEEVCLCCGYKIEPGDLVISSGFGDKFGYKGSDPSKAGGNTSGTISYYTNTVALGDIGLGRDGTLGANWSQNSPFMYNGDDNLKTDKGHNLKINIENTGENIYAKQPEYAYFLTPDSLRVIRSYNDVVGYDLDMDKLKVYESNAIVCDGATCSEGGPETISFQHYGSKLLVGELDEFNADLKPYGAIKNSYTNVCLIDEDNYSSTYDIMGSLMEPEQCRWVDYLEKDNIYYNPTTKTSSNTYFRLAFK